MNFNEIVIIVFFCSLLLFFLFSWVAFLSVSTLNMATSEFDLKFLADSLEKCKQEDGSISIDDYLDAYDQISK